MNVSSFCNAFLHIEPTPEAGLKEFCLCSAKKCYRKCIVCIIRLQNSKGDDILEKVFKNNTNHDIKYTTHAEEMGMRDDEIVAHMPLTSKMIFYITYNPCHFSGGHKGYCNDKSCTLQILQFKERFPNVEFEIIISYTYRAHWRTYPCECAFVLAPVKYAPNILTAQHGIYLLVSNGVRIRSFEMCDYTYLECFMNEDMLCVWKEKRDVILQKRAEIDSFVQKVIDEYSFKWGHMWACTKCHT
jgi:hypothetical protein